MTGSVAGGAEDRFLALAVEAHAATNLAGALARLAGTEARAVALTADWRFPIALAGDARKFAAILAFGAIE